MRVLCVFGTRPEAIKLAPVLRELRRRPDGVTTRVCVTAQHRQMLDQVLELFDIVPDHDLDLMEENQSPTSVAAEVLEGLEGVIREDRPDWLLVQGDTTTVAAASIAAFYAGVQVGHVEAGLRTHDKWRPFPEEINRRLAGVIADIHFAPTARARTNLLSEGVSPDRIIVTGNPVIDALRWMAAGEPGVPRVLEGRLEDPAPRLMLLTAHRRENFPVIADICRAAREIARKYEGDVVLVCPVHPNPNVTRRVHAELASLPNVVLSPPLDYRSIVQILQRAHLVLTDSGGLQEEAPALGVPVLVLREVTERPEAVEAGAVRLVGTNPEAIVAETSKLLDDDDHHRRMARAVNPYGDGRAAERIVSALLGERVEPFEPPKQVQAVAG